MGDFIPAFLQQHILQFGAEGTHWLAHLPLRIAELEQEWGLRVGSAFDHGGAVSWVAPVELRDGSEAVLKISIPQDEARFEAQALRFLDGRGAVRLLQASDDGFSLLLERCRPGTDLWPLGEEEGNAVACQMLTRMWREPDPSAPFVSLSDYVANWWDDLPRLTATAAYEGDVVAEVVARGRELLDAMTVTLVLLCHPIATEASHGGVQVCVKPIVARCLPSAPMSSSQQKQRGMSLACGRLIESYAQGLLEKGEFEPRVGGSKSVWRRLKHKRKFFPKKPPRRPVCG